MRNFDDFDKSFDENRRFIQKAQGQMIKVVIGFGAGAFALLAAAIFVAWKIWGG